VSFFVMLVAFSNQDSQKVQAVAGSMRDAFGVQRNVRLPGITEFDGLITRAKLKNSVHVAPEDSSVTPTPNEEGSGFVSDKAFGLAAVSLRQALQSLPELTEASKHIIMQETK
jgi:chemotaxis protein MotB